MERPGERIRTRGNCRAGQTLILFTLAIIPIFGIIGLVVDIGWAYYRKEVAKTAADAAANAAVMAAFAAAGGGAVTCSTPGVACYATDYVCPSGTIAASDNINIGCLYASANGFSSSGTQTVTFKAGGGTPPGSTGVSVGYWVVAKVSERIPQSFSAVLGFPAATVAAEASAGDQSPAAGSGGCIFALATTGSGTLSLTGSSYLQSGCGVYVNSNSASALTMTGSSIVTTTGVAKTHIVGGWTTSGGSTVSPAPVTGVATMSDPWSAMAAPTVGDCTDGGAGVRLSGSTQTISPGVFCGGITLSSSSVLTLTSGLYIVKSGISLTGSSIITGTGVTIYLYSGGISATGSSKLTISAPASGTWQGIALFQDRTNSSGASLSGSTSQAINGLMYLPAAAISYSGGNSANATATTIVANTISLTGSTYIRAPATTAFTPGGGGTVVLR